MRRNKKSSRVRSNRYWGGKPKIDRVEVLYLPETAARTLAFVKGDVDMIEGADGAWLAGQPEKADAGPGAGFRPSRRDGRHCS